jgi:DNA modification methylase
MVEKIKEQIRGSPFDADIQINHIYEMDNLELLEKINNGRMDLIFYDPDPPCKEDFIQFYSDISKISGYLGLIRDRIIEFHRVLRKTGCFYVYAKGTAKFELKLLIDTIFGRKNFRKEIFIKNGKSKEVGTLHDTIFLYSKTENFLFNVKKWRERDIRREYFVYPEQKSLDMLTKIIAASTKKNDLVADFACGSGTTLVAAKILERNFIGCDKNKKAIEITKLRLRGVT